MVALTDIWLYIKIPQGSQRIWIAPWWLVAHKRHLLYVSRWDWSQTKNSEIVFCCFRSFLSRWCPFSPQLLDGETLQLADESSPASNEKTSLVFEIFWCKFCTVGGCDDAAAIFVWVSGAECVTTGIRSHSLRSVNLISGATEWNVK